MALADFHLLLLEDDPERRASLEQAARKSGLQGRHHAVGRGDEAVDYLKHALDGASRLRPCRMPSLFLLNLDLPSSLQTLGWLRAQPRLRRMVTIGLFSREDGALVDRAYELGVNSCLVRPTSFEDLVGMFRSIRQYWASLNQPPHC